LIYLLVVRRRAPEQAERSEAVANGAIKAPSRTMRPVCGLILRDAAKRPFLRMRIKEFN